MYTGRLLEGKRKIIYLGVIFCCKELGLSNNNALRSHFYLMFLVSFYIFSFLLLKLHWKRRQGRHFFPFFQVIKLRCGEAKTPRIWVLEPWFYNVYNPGLLLPGQWYQVVNQNFINGTFRRQNNSNLTAMESNFVPSNELNNDI